MSTSKRTPGPWSADPLYDPQNGYEVEAQDDLGRGKFVLATVWYDETGDEESKTIAGANARLVAAAPDLLAACQTLMEFWDNNTPVHPGALCVEECRAAIAKAEGRI